MLTIQTSGPITVTETLLLGQIGIAVNLTIMPDLKTVQWHGILRILNGMMIVVPTYGHPFVNLPWFLGTMECMFGLGTNSKDLKH